MPLMSNSQLAFTNVTRKNKVTVNFNKQRHRQNKNYLIYFGARFILINYVHNLNHKFVKSFHKTLIYYRTPF